MVVHMKIKIEKQILMIKPCTHFFSRFLGMMGRRKKMEYGFYFPKCSSIHTFFMFQKIDVIMVDKANHIIAYYPQLKPYKIVSCKNAVSCYEFSTGILNNVSIGKSITIL